MLGPLGLGLLIGLILVGIIPILAGINWPNCIAHPNEVSIERDSGGGFFVRDCYGLSISYHYTAEEARSAIERMRKEPPGIIWRGTVGRN